MKQPFLDFLVDKISNTTLFEMAYERKHAKSIVTGLSPQIFKHLLKLYTFDYPIGYNHWINELNTFINKINDIYLKPNNQKISSNVLYEWLVNESAPCYNTDYISNQIKLMKRQEYKDISLKPFDTQQVLDNILNIFKQVSIDVSSNNFESIEDYLNH